MKKSVYESILSLISTIDTPEAEEVRAEVSAELAKGKAKADANRELYAEYHEKVVEVLARENKSLSAQDIADETGIARGKIVYGLKNYWTNEVEVDSSGKANTYRLK